ncbi:MAG: hypothetical protein KKA73_18635 [Chloroflexi bacterium]|nr:hypothetical protein [Chloroflexota bacterium]
MSAQPDAVLPLPLAPLPLAYTALVLQGIWALTLLPSAASLTIRAAALDGLARRVEGEAQALGPLTRFDD